MGLARWERIVRWQTTSAEGVQVEVRAADERADPRGRGAPEAREVVARRVGQHAVGPAEVIPPNAAGAAPATPPVGLAATPVAAGNGTSSARVSVVARAVSGGVPRPTGPVVATENVLLGVTTENVLLGVATVSVPPGLATVSVSVPG